MTILSHPGLPHQSEYKEQLKVSGNATMSLPQGIEGLSRNFSQKMLLLLASLLLLAEIQQTAAQTYLTDLPNGSILPVASIFVDGQWIDTYENDPETANAAFFCDPVGSGYYPGGSSGGLINLSMSASIPSENMIPETTHAGSVQAVIGGNTSVTYSARGSANQCAAYVVTNNQVWLAVCCYCNRGPSLAGDYGGEWNEYYSYNHFQIRVESSQWSAGAFQPYSDSQGNIQTWNVVTNAGVDVLYQPNGDMNDINPALLAADTVLVYNPAAATLQVNAPSAGPNCYLADLSKPQWPDSVSGSDPLGVVMLIPITLPQQPVNMLRIAVQAWDASTPADLAAGGFFYSDSYVNDQLGFFYPNGLDYNLGPNGNGPAPDDQGYGVIFEGANDFNSYSGPNSGYSAISDYSPPFVVAMKPANLLPYNEFPIGLIYNLPGDKSSISYTAGSGFNTSWQFSTSEADQVANVQGQSVNFSLNGASLLSSVGSFFGTPVSGSGSGSSVGGFMDTVGYNNGSSASSTVTATTQYQDTLALSSSMLFGTGYNLSMSTNKPPPDRNTGVWQEPFWYDQIVVMPGPIFGSWSLPAVGGSPPGLAQQLVGFLGDQPPTPVYFFVKDLYCAYRNNTTCWDETRQLLQIGPNESYELACLDPFFTARWQGLNPTAVYPNRFIFVKELTDVGIGTINTFNVTEGTQLTVNNVQTMVNNEQSQQSSGFSLTLGAFGFDLGANFDTQMTTIGTTLTLQNQQSSALTTTITASGTIEDDEGFPGPLYLYYDEWANSFCIQDGGEPNPANTPSASDSPPFCQSSSPYTISIPVPSSLSYVLNPNAPHLIENNIPPYPLIIPPPIGPISAYSMQLSLPGINPVSSLAASAVLPSPPFALKPPLIPQSASDSSEPSITSPQISP